MVWFVGWVFFLWIYCLFWGLMGFFWGYFLCCVCFVGLVCLFGFFFVLLVLFVGFSCFPNPIATAQDCMVWVFLCLYHMFL